MSTRRRQVYKDDAVRTCARELRQHGLVEYSRLHSAGRLYQTILGAIEAGVRDGSFDRPHRGQVRAVWVDAESVPKELWDRGLWEFLSAGDGPIDRDSTVYGVAEWAKVTLGLEFQRIRTGGKIESGVKNAIRRAIRMGIVEAHGKSGIALSDLARGGNTEEDEEETPEPDEDVEDVIDAADLIYEEDSPPVKQFPVVEIGEQNVIVFQASPRVSFDALQDLIFECFDAASQERRGGATWLAFGRSGMLHHRGYSSWIGVSMNLPISVIDFIQRRMEGHGMQVERDIGPALRHRLMPFARLSSDGLELLTPAALSGPNEARRVVPRGSSAPVVRGYRLRP